MIILGIETSCDETSAAVVRDGGHVLSSVVASQIALHHPFGGVVPELASRKHLESITQIVHEAVEQSGISGNHLDAVAATQGPGLVGALLVGFSFAKAYAYAQEIPCIGVDHLEGHIHSLFLEQDIPDFPFVALLVSGGHTGIYDVTSHTSCELMGQTRDDAVGEAFDKVAKMLGLGYPGGVVIEQMAFKGNPEQIHFPRPCLDTTDFDFSFSGLKSAVRRYIELNGATNVPDIVAGFQKAATEVLTTKLVQAALSRKRHRIAVVGGVAANSELRRKISASAPENGLRVYLPSLKYCGDNAAMIAAAGFHRYPCSWVKNTLLDQDVYSKARLRNN